MKKNYLPHLATSYTEDALIFISHSSKDVWIVSNFVEKILILGLGIPRNNIFFTSEADTGVRSGHDFVDGVLEKLKASEAVIQIISENYKKSEACLIERGASWALSKKVIAFTHSLIEPNTASFLHKTTQLLKLNMEEDLFKFQDDHCDLNGGKKISQSYYYKQVIEFVAIINKNNYKIGSGLLKCLPDNEIEPLKDDCLKNAA